MVYEHKTGYDGGFVVEFLSHVNDSRCESWMLLPAENLWNKGIRGVLYFLAMFYLFLGIAIASDIFMNSIEVMTSKKKKIIKFDQEKNEAHEVEVHVWNETVANLTLMALGSSAPEILLALIETSTNLGKEVATDSLGTFTIIGSAAFNLLIITSVCIVSVDTPHIKYIKEFGVFLMTASWSLYAYIWMLIVVQFSSPGIIEPWEAWMTLAYMPIFVLLAYCQDNGWWFYKCKKHGQVDDSEIENHQVIHYFHL